MPNNILFIFEGEKTEDAIAHVLKTHILKEDMIITCAFTSDIYSLYRVLKEDDDIDTFALLKEKPTNKTRLKRIIATTLQKYTFSLITTAMQP